MANRVLWLNYRLTGGNFDAYTEMQSLSFQSACRHLAGDWTAEIATGNFTDRPFELGYSDMYREMFGLLREFHEQRDNVLFLDPDIIFVKPTDIFALERDEMRLFWVTDPSQRDQFDTYLNGGVAYLPALMNPELWRFVDSAADRMAEWNDSQDILNAMFWAQDPAPELRPELGWSTNVQNGCSREDAHLIHFNSTRGAEQVLQHMRELVA